MRELVYFDLSIYSALSYVVKPLCNLEESNIIWSH